MDACLPIEKQLNLRVEVEAIPRIRRRLSRFLPVEDEHAARLETSVPRREITVRPPTLDLFGAQLTSSQIQTPPAQVTHTLPKMRGQLPCGGHRFDEF